MLRRAENVQLFYKRDLWGLLIGRRYRILLQIGRKEHLIPGRVPVEDFRALKARSDQQPVCFGRIGERAYWRLADRWYWDNDGLQADAIAALLHTRELRKDDTIKRAKTLAAVTAPQTVPVQRGAIPEDVKLLVWHRDGGCCRTCGSNIELQYDHVIPISLGGGSTEDNLQILCGPCNRRKGASVA